MVEQVKQITKIIIIPGNDVLNCFHSNWYGWMHEQLTSFVQKNKLDIKVVLPQCMPDPIKAREEIWVPYIRDKLAADEQTMYIGHSSGAVAGMRLAENTKLAVLLLVAACHTDLGIENEKQSGYYSRDWQWDKIKQNCGQIFQYHSKNDRWIPMAEADHISKNLNSEYHTNEDKNHFFDIKDCDEILDRILQIIQGK